MWGTMSLKYLTDTDIPTLYQTKTKVVESLKEVSRMAFIGFID